jgi:hypothetical protein
MVLSMKSGGSIAAMRGRIQALSSYAVDAAAAAPIAGDQRGCR